MSRPQWPRSGSTVRRYPALDEYRDAYGHGEPYPIEHPISRAARHEANAQELYMLADKPATSSLSRQTWLAAGDGEMGIAARILVDADRREHVVV
jgi:hypothetical protein